MSSEMTTGNFPMTTTQSQSEDKAHADIALVCALAIEVDPLLERCEKVRKYTGGKFVFRGGRYDQIRLALPEELKVSRRVMAERDQILAEAGDQAQRVVEQAQEQVAQLVNQHSIVRTAENQAQALMDRVEREAQDTRSQADDYAFRVLSSLNNRLLQIGNLVQEGLAELRPERRRPDQ